MEPPYSALSYSFLADWLNKFHTASEPIQALWLTLGALTILGVTWLVMRGVRETMTAWREQAEPRGRLIHGVFEDGEGRVLVWRKGEQSGELASFQVRKKPGLSRRTPLPDFGTTTQAGILRD